MKEIIEVVVACRGLGLGRVVAELVLLGRVVSPFPPPPPFSLICVYWE